LRRRASIEAPRAAVAVGAQHRRNDDQSSKPFAKIVSGE
jgi:hypothetical protein